MLTGLIYSTATRNWANTGSLGTASRACTKLPYASIHSCTYVHSRWVRCILHSWFAITAPVVGKMENVKVEGGHRRLAGCHFVPDVGEKWTSHAQIHTHAHTRRHNVHSHCSLVEGDGGRARRAWECFLRSTVHYIHIPPVCKEWYSTQRCYSVHNKNAVVPVGWGGGSAISGPVQVEGRRVTTEV